MSIDETLLAYRDILKQFKEKELVFVADLAGVSISTLKYLRYGYERNFTVGTLRKIDDALSAFSVSNDAM